MNSHKSIVSPSTTTNTTLNPSVKPNTYSNSMILLFCIIIGGVICVVLYKIVTTTKINLKSANFAKKPVEPSKEHVDILAVENELPAYTNGKEYAYSFWMYIDNIVDDSNHGLVFFKSSNSSYEDTNFKGVNTVVYLERNTNKLKIKLRTLNADQNNVAIDVSTDNKKGIDGILNIKGTDSKTTLHNDNCYYSDFTIDYVPLQRWVNITINIDNNLVSIFLDGDLLSTKNLSSSDSSNCNTLLSTIISNKPGNIFIGSEKKQNLQTFNGVISNFKAFNYSITLDYVKTIYSLGPISKSLLSTVGLPLYSFRNPLYRVDEVKSCNVNANAKK